MNHIDPNEINTDRYRQALESITRTDPESFSEISGQGMTLDLRDSVPVVQRMMSLFGRIRESHVGADPAGFDELRRQAETAVGQIESRNEQSSGILDESKTALDQIKKAAAEAGVAQHAIIFEEVAKRHRKASYVWLAVSFLLAVATFGLAWQMAGQVADRTLSDTIQFVAARIIIFGVLSYGLVSAVRSYGAEAHNRVVNAHRHHALSTFEIFTAAGSDDATKNAVLMQATQCIFSHRPSGFGQREDDAAPQSQVLELTRNVLPKTSE